MKYFPIRVVVLCILLTPILYTGTLSVIEKGCEPYYRERLENQVVDETHLLMNGTMEISEMVEQNIQRFLDSDIWVSRFGLQLDILVFANEGDILYPFFPEMIAGGLDDYLTRPTDPLYLGRARHNYDILRQGLTVRVRPRLRHGTLGANIILSVYAALAMGVFWIFYRRGLGRSLRESRETGRELSALRTDEKAHRKTLESLKKEREKLLEKMADLRKSYQETRRKASITEEEMFEEIVSLEKRLNENVGLQKEKTYEIEVLKDRLKKYEQKKGGIKKHRKGDFIAKRLSVLYKNVDVSRRALTGFLDLNDEHRIKAEEVIHQLNSDPDKVVVKRKVFAGKKHRLASFEVLFSYNGRLYFRKGEDHRIEVVVIGTKNTQDKDMDFLHRN